MRPKHKTMHFCFLKRLLVQIPGGRLPWALGKVPFLLDPSFPLCLTEIQTSDLAPPYVIPKLVETQFFSCQTFAVSDSGLCIYFLHHHQPQFYVPTTKPTTMKTLTGPEYSLQLGCQTLALQDPPQISPSNALYIIAIKGNKKKPST